MRPLILFWVINAIAGSVPVHQDRDGADFSIAVDVRLVLFNVSVTDNRGRHISGLKASDFRVAEEGRVQEIKLFSPEDVPATIGLIIDNSGSMRPKRTDVQRAVLTFVQDSNPADEMFLVNFNEKVYMPLPKGMPFSSNVALIRWALDRMPPDGRTALYDAITAGFEHLKTGTHERKALVVLSDGGDNASRQRLNDVVEMALQSNATVYAIGIFDNTDLDRNPGVLRKIAKSGGGRAYFPESKLDLDRAWREIAGEIRGQYTIGYISTVSSPNGVFRKVKITVSQKLGNSLQVNARDGYVVPSESPQREEKQRELNGGEAK